MMAAEDSPSRSRRFGAGLVLCALVLAVFALGVALFIIGLVGIALLVAGVSSWLHPGDVASAWARTLGGIGLIAASAGFAALGWLGVERLSGRLAAPAHLRWRALRSGSEAETALQRGRKFVAVIGILLALICLPFAAAIGVGAPGPWLGWGGPSQGRIMCTPGNHAPRCAVSRPHSSQP